MQVRFFPGLLVRVAKRIGFLTILWSYNLYIRFMKKVFFICALVFLFCSCNEGKKGKEIVEKQSIAFDVKKIPSKLIAGAEAVAVLKDWTEYNAFVTSYDALYKVKDEEGLSLVIEDLIEKQKLLKDSAYPEMFNVPQIKSRQKVFKTYVLKVKGCLEYKIETITATIEMVKAYNSLTKQFSVILKSKVDIDLLLEE